MESDDDYQSFSPLEQSSPPLHHRRLKRLKKSIKAPPSDPSLKYDVDELLGLPRVDFARLEALEAGKALGFDDSSEPLQSQLPSQDLDDESELNAGFDGLHFDDDPKEARRALEFDNKVPDGSDGGKRGDQRSGMELESSYLNAEKSEKKRINGEGLNEEKGEKKKKRSKRSDNNVIPKPPSSNRRTEERERKAYLQQLHADSQRLLRETRDAAFKPVPVVQKAISSVLEKIRQRKLEVSKKIAIPNNNNSLVGKYGSQTEARVDLDFGNLLVEERKIDKVTRTMEAGAPVHSEGVQDSSNLSHNDGSKESAAELNHGNIKSQMDLNEQPTHSFRAPLDDSQDLFTGSQASSDSKYEFADDMRNSPLEEVLAPSVLAMNLKFDSALPDDISSDEEDNNKENVDPHPHNLDDGCSSKGDPVKAFVDDEAEEEDDSDHDLARFKESEDEDNEDSEDLNDMIATEYEERPIDNERRNELHQKWLEQQDAAGTDNLLQRLKYGSKKMETTMLEEEEENGEDEEEFDGEDEDVPPANLGRLNQRRAKQIIIQMFSDTDVAFLSDDDEEAEKTLVKQHILVQAEEQAALLPPAEDESSREVFSLIKKLNNVPETRKKTKALSFFDSVLRGKTDSTSKSSFLGRGSNHSLPSSHKQGSSMVRSFIFGRDDSNNCSSISMPEDSFDMISKENQPTRSLTNKFSGSQAKSSQRLNGTAEMASGTSLFEILKQSSMQSNVCNQDSMGILTRTMFDAFKIPKKRIKMEGKS